MKRITFSLVVGLLFSWQAHGQISEDWQENRLAVRALSVQVSNTKKTIEELMQEKSMTQDNLQKQEIMRMITAEHRSLRDMSRKLDQKIELMRFRFPGRGKESQEKYYRDQVREVEELSTELDLDQKLDKAVALMIRQFGEADQPSVGAKLQTRPLTENTTIRDPSRRPASVDEEKPILMSR